MTDGDRDQPWLPADLPVGAQALLDQYVAKCADTGCKDCLADRVDSPDFALWEAEVAPW